MTVFTFAGKTSASGYANMLNAGAAEDATIRNLLLLKTPTYDSSLALSILLDMSNNPGEIPRRILEGSVMAIADVWHGANTTTTVILVCRGDVNGETLTVTCNGSILPALSILPFTLGLLKSQSPD